MLYHTYLACPNQLEVLVRQVDDVVHVLQAGLREREGELEDLCVACIDGMCFGVWRGWLRGCVNIYEYGCVCVCYAGVFGENEVCGEDGFGRLVSQLVRWTDTRRVVVGGQKTG